jgi:hypothetical protein
MNYTDYISAAQYGKLAKLSHQRIYKLIEAGRLDYIIIAGRKFIHKDAKIKRGELVKAL